MATLFDDLIPQQAAPQASHGATLFDDLIPAKAEAKEERPGMLGQAVEGARDFADQFVSQGALMGFGDELFGAVNTPVEMGIRAFTGADAGKGLGERISGAYAAGRDWRRGQDKAAQARSPIASTAGEVAGAVATGGTAAKGGITLLNAGRASVPGMAARGAGEGATYGALHGFGTGEGMDDSINRSVMGGTVGAVTGGALGGATGAMARRAASKNVPTTEKLGKQASKLYRTAEGMGIAVKNESFGPAVVKIARELDGAGFNPRMHPNAAVALDDMFAAANSGRPLELSKIDQLRQIAGDAARSTEAKERRIGRILIAKLDDYLDNLGGADVIGKDPKAAVDTYKYARALTRRKKKAELVEEAFYGADLRTAATGSGGNINNKIRQNVASILLNPKKARMFSAEDKAAMEKLVRGGKGQNALRLLGKLSPQGNGLMLAFGIGGTAANPLLATVPAAGAGAKFAADRMTTTGAKHLAEALRAGSHARPAMRLTGPEDALLRALLIGSSQQGGDAVSGMTP